MDKTKLLLATDLPEADVDVPGKGTVRVRGLTRKEALTVADAKTTALSEREIIRFGMVEPRLSSAEVERWQATAAANELDGVLLKITELSGIAEGADKEAAARFPE